MKVAVQCESPLLQRSLELFLEGHLSSLKQCDVVVRDFKSDDDSHLSLYISNDETADILKPFSRSQLYLALEQILKQHDDADAISTIADELEEKQTQSETDDSVGTEETAGSDFSILERRIEMLTKEYQKNILEAVRAFYEK